MMAWWNSIKRALFPQPVTSETLEAEALAMLAAKPGQLVPVKNLEAHIRAGTFSRVAALRDENDRIIYDVSCTSAVYDTNDDIEYVRGAYGYPLRCTKVS